MRTRGRNFPPSYVCRNVTRPSRTAHRRSNRSSARATDTAARSVTERSLTSVTASVATRPSHSGCALQSRATSSRTAPIGTAGSTGSKTGPINALPIFVQFWNGVSRKRPIGTTMRRSSHNRTTTYVRLISSMNPVSSSIVTMSPRRIGCVSEIWIPATMPPSDFCAAKPKTTPATPADASSDTPTERTISNWISSTAHASRPTTSEAIRRVTSSWVR